MKPKRRFPKSSYHYKYRADKKARMTYILGSRCRDGVVMIADRKFTVDYGSSYLHDNKLVHEVAGIVVGFSGSRGVFELFQTHKKTCYGIRRRDCSRRIYFKNI